MIEANSTTLFSGLSLVLFLAASSAVTTSAQAVPDESRIDCTPDRGTGEDECNARGCIYQVWDGLSLYLNGFMLVGGAISITALFQPADAKGVPWCYYPETYGYTLEGVFETVNGIGANLVRNAGIGSMFGNDFERINLEAEFQTEDRLRIRITYESCPSTVGPQLMANGLKPLLDLIAYYLVRYVILISRPAEGPPRFEVPLNISAGPTPANQKYEVNFAQGDNIFGFQAMIWPIYHWYCMSSETLSNVECIFPSGH